MFLIGLVWLFKCLESPNLSRVYVDTKGYELPQNDEVLGDVYFEGNGKTEVGDFSSFVRIKYRGSSSRRFPKKQYKIELINGVLKNQPVSFWGLNYDEDFILHAPYSDKTLVRNLLAYDLFSGLGHFGVKGVPVELYLNNEYQGIYIVFEKPGGTFGMDREPFVHRKKKTPEFDFFIKIDKPDRENKNVGWTSPYLPEEGSWKRIQYQLVNPKVKHKSWKMDSMRHWINNLETEIMTIPFNKDSGYSDKIDLPSLVDYILINEFAKNLDAYRSSAFYYRYNMKLYAGPLWDVNLGFGNIDYADGEMVEKWTYPYRHNPAWLKRLMKDSSFVELVATRWFELRNNQWSDERVYNKIDSLVQVLSPARERNFTKWPVIGEKVWPNFYIGETYEDEVSYLKSWISQRYLWLDEQFENPSSLYSD